MTPAAKSAADRRKASGPVATVVKRRRRVRDTELDPDKLMLDGVETPEPTFTVSEAAKVFFGMSAAWLRWRDKEGAFVLNGKKVGQTRIKQANDRRVYTLSDIELIVHALGQRDMLDGRRVALALRVVKSLAQLYGYLPAYTPKEK